MDLSEARKELFWSKVRKSSGCWEWLSSRGSGGYGQISFRMKVDGISKTKRIDTHRLSFLITKGPIPIGLVVMHSCDNKTCVNPDHLSLGTQKDNVRDCLSKGRMKARGYNQTHCKNGHEYNKANTKMYGNRRRCVICCKIKSTESLKLLQADPVKHAASKEKMKLWAREYRAKLKKINQE